jgi:poly-gamma-glutamate synthesis protein (capsule biosynthesis protein)
MYLADLDLASGALVALEMVPLQIRRFQLVPASRADVDWLLSMLDRQTQTFGARIKFEPNRGLVLCRTQDEQLPNSGSARALEF